MKLIDWQNTGWQNRAHFFGIAAQLMRQILVDEARRPRAGKHGGNAMRVSMGAAESLAKQKDHGLLALDDALKALAELVERIFDATLEVNDAGRAALLAVRKNGIG